mmetsp:Transcript_16350/g.19976  ORF Transcript_16350/g.19976 Transcript_16350/m.19976 type:complete len:201 (+) Transcript_16350:129-731(+)
MTKYTGIVYCFVLLFFVVNNVSCTDLEKENLKLAEPAETQYISSRRGLSVWSSFLNFVKCPPGPLGKHCNDSKGSRSSSSGDSSSSSSWGSSSNSASNSGSSENKYFNWYNGGSGVDAEEDQDANGASGMGNKAFPWVLLVLGLVAVATGVGYMAHRTSKNEGQATVKTFKQRMVATFSRKKKPSTGNEYMLSEDGATLA